MRGDSRSTNRASKRASKLEDPDINGKVLAVKRLSIGFTLLTTPLFAFLTGVAVNLVSEGLRPAGG